MKFQVGDFVELIPEEEIKKLWAHVHGNGSWELGGVVDTIYGRLREICPVRIKEISNGWLKLEVDTHLDYYWVEGVFVRSEMEFSDPIQPPDDLFSALLN